MTVSLRAHHLLCMLTFSGKGYTPEFAANFGHIIRRLNAGEDIRIVAGPDSICQPLLGEPDCHCHRESVTGRDVLAAAEIEAVLGFAPNAGSNLHLDRQTIETLRQAFASGAIRSGCDGCEWHALCTSIAQNAFRGCRLRPPLTKTSI